MATTILRNFNATLTQGSADAFVEGSISTGLQPADGFAFRILVVEILLAQGLPINNNPRIEWSICRDSKLAVAGLDDEECMYSDAIENRLLTSGAAQTRCLITHRPEGGLLVVEPTIWIQMDSNNTTLSNSADFRLHYDTVKLTEVEILRLLNNV